MLDYLYLDTVIGSAVLHQTSGTRSVTDASGLVGITQVRGDAFESPDDDGGIEPDAQRLSTKVFPIQGEVWGDTINAAWLEWDVLAAAFVATKDQLGTLRWQRAGGGKAFARRVKLAGPVEPPISDGQQMLDYQVTFRSPDPCAYSQTTKSATIDPTIGAVGGISIPLVFPLDLGGSSTGGLTLTNEGNYQSRRVTYTLLGPWVSPSLVNEATGKTIASSLSLGAGELLVVDCDARTVTYQGADATNTIAWRTSRWPVLIPGGNVIAIGGFPSGGSSLAVSYLDAFIS